MVLHFEDERDLFYRSDRGKSGAQFQEAGLTYNFPIPLFIWTVDHFINTPSIHALVLA